MRSCLFSLCYLEGQDASGGSRLLRNIQYLNYYLSIQDEIGFDSIWLVDNASKIEDLAMLDAHVYDVDDKYKKLLIGRREVMVARFQNHLSRIGVFDYPYCWRGLYYISELIHTFNYDKIICIDTDGYVLSRRLATFIREMDTGWQTFWCPKWNFPDSAIHIINRDAFSNYFAFLAKKNGFMDYKGVCMEKALPFTHVHRQFICDRFGEDKVPQSKGMDFYGQKPTHMTLFYDPKII